MKSVMKFLMVAVAFTFVQSAIYAQHEDHPREKDPQEMAEKRTEKLVEKLDLSDEQAAKVKALNLRQVEEMKVLREQLRQKRQALREESNLEMKQILSADQYAKFEKMVAARKEKKDGKRKGPRGNRGKKGQSEKG